MEAVKAIYDAHVEPLVHQRQQQDRQPAIAPVRPQNAPPTLDSLRAKSRSMKGAQD